MRNSGRPEDNSPASRPRIPLYPSGAAGGNSPPGSLPAPNFGNKPQAGDGSRRAAAPQPSRRKGWVPAFPPSSQAGKASFPWEKPFPSLFLSRGSCPKRSRIPTKAAKFLGCFQPATRQAPSGSKGALSGLLRLQAAVFSRRIGERRLPIQRERRICDGEKGSRRWSKRGLLQRALREHDECTGAGTNPSGAAME